MCNYEGLRWNMNVLVNLLFVCVHSLQHHKRREGPGDEMASIETTVQMVDDQRLNFIFKMADAGR